MARLTQKQNRIVYKLTRLHRFLEENDIEIENAVGGIDFRVEDIDIDIGEYVQTSKSILNIANILISDFDSNSSVV